MTNNMQFSNISEFNTHLSDRLIKYDINVYFNTIHSKFSNNVDISFMDYFLSLITKKDEFCVEHTKLIEYGIIKERNDNTNIKNCIMNKYYDFKENIDYIILTPERSGVKREGRGGSNGNAKHYKMKPHVFKMCLMRSKNENKYAKYFLELEECFYYYKDYQIKYQNVLLSGKDTKIDELKDSINKQREENRKETEERKKQYEELLKHAKNTNEKLNEVKEQNVNLSEDINEINEKLDEAKEDIENLTDKVEEVRDEFRENTEHINPPPEDVNDMHMFIVLQYQNELNKFKIIRGQNKYLDKTVTKGMNIVIEKRYHPNPIDAFTALKDKVKKLDKNTINKIKDDFKNKSISINEKN